MALFRFDNFCEAWAQCYTKIRHVPSKDGRTSRFFRHNSLDERSEIHKRLPAFDRCNLFMSVITAVEGEVDYMSERAADPNCYVWRRHVLFWAHQTPADRSVVPNNEEAAADAKISGVEAAQDFIAFITMCRNEKDKEHYIPELRGVVEESYNIATLPMSFDGWWVTVLNFDQTEPRLKCVIDEKYDQTSLQEFFPFFHHDRFPHTHVKT